MAKYEVTHRCQHAETVTLFGASKDRERKLEWLSSLPCPECCSIDRITSAGAIHELQEAAGLPRLVGSEKQVAWAVQLRQDFLLGWKKIERKLTEVALTEDASAKLAEELLFEGDAFIAGPLARSDAKYWIDHRDELTESSVNSHLYKIRHEIADQAKATVGANIPISDSDKREVIRMAMEARKTALEERRQQAAEAKQQIASRAAAEALNKQQALWAKKDRLAAAIHAAIGNHRAELSIYWKGAEKRIYLDSGATKACLYVTGNARNRPGSMDAGIGAAFLAEQLPGIRVALEMADKDWKNIRIVITADGKAE